MNLTRELQIAESNARKLRAEHEQALKRVHEAQGKYEPPKALSVTMDLGQESAIVWDFAIERRRERAEGVARRQRLRANTIAERFLKPSFRNLWGLRY